MNSYADWLHGLADKGGKGAIDNIDARALGVCANIIDTLEEEKKKLTDKNEELEQLFNLTWEADMRAIKLWQKSTGEKLVWPDQVKLIVWLLEQRDKRTRSYFLETAVLFGVIGWWVAAHMIWPEYMGVLYG